MTIEEIDQALATLNASIDTMKGNARELVREREKQLARAKIAAMSPAEQAALREAMKGE